MALLVEQVDVEELAVGDEDDAVGADGEMLGLAQVAVAVAGAAEVQHQVSPGVEDLDPSVHHVRNVKLAAVVGGQAHREVELARLASGVADGFEVV